MHVLSIKVSIRKKSGNLFNDPHTYIYIYIYIYIHTHIRVIRLMNKNNTQIEVRMVILSIRNYKPCFVFDLINIWATSYIQNDCSNHFSNTQVLIRLKDNLYFKSNTLIQQQLQNKAVIMETNFGRREKRDKS